MPIDKMTYIQGSRYRWPPREFDETQVQWHDRFLSVAPSRSRGGGWETSTNFDLPHGGSLGIYSGSISFKPQPLDKVVVHTCFRLLAKKACSRYVTTYHNPPNEIIHPRFDNKQVNMLAYINYWIWGTQEEIEQCVNVQLRLLKVDYF